MTLTERIAKFIVGLSADRAGPETLRAARYEVLDMIAAATYARDVPEAAAVVRAHFALGERGSATVVATGERLPPAAAAAANACYAMAHDFDDILWAGHTCHSAVFAALAVAEHEGRSADELLLAVIAANEVAGRLGASAYFGPLNGQMVTYIHLVGAAAAAAKLLRLDEQQTAHALAISLAQPNFALQPAFMGPSSKLLSAAVPLGTGLQAAYLAQQGVEGHLGIIEDARGFWRNFAFVPMPSMFDDLGDFWATQTLSMKYYPGCHYFQTACEAFTELMRGKRAADIVRIDVATTKLACEATAFGAEYRGDALRPIDVNFDLTLTLAVLALAGDVGREQLEAGWLEANRAAIDAWRERITVKHDPALTLKVLSSGGAIESGRRGLELLTPATLLSLARRYGERYGSRLIGLDEAFAWVKALLSRPEVQAVQGSAVPLAFPSRVTIRWTSGESSELQADVPAGTFALSTCEATLRAKWRKTVGDDAAFELGLRLGAVSLAELLAALRYDGGHSSAAAA